MFKQACGINTVHFIAFPTGRYGKVMFPLLIFKNASLCGECEMMFWILFYRTVGYCFCSYCLAYFRRVGILLKYSVT